VKQSASVTSGHFHAVRFYQDEQSLYRIVADFIGDGVVAGEPAVVITTPLHGEMISRELEALACDVSRLQASGELLILDAEETLSTFMKDCVPDPVAFQSSVGGALDRATAGRPHASVRAYGGVVDCLWKVGQCDAAIRLEVLWNQLANTRAFSLLCGYCMGNFYKHGAYEHICDHHTHVLSAGGHPTRIVVA
jgi:MEDS: MEthanogen/methylotroph, DcmR Sensory domain